MLVSLRLNASKRFTGKKNVVCLCFKAHSRTRSICYEIVSLIHHALFHFHNSAGLVWTDLKVSCVKFTEEARICNYHTAYVDQDD